MPSWKKLIHVGIHVLKDTKSILSILLASYPQTVLQDIIINKASKIANLVMFHAKDVSIPLRTHACFVLPDCSSIQTPKPVLRSVLRALLRIR